MPTFKTKSQKAETDDGLSINYKRGVKVILTGLVITGVVAYVGITGFKFANKVSEARDAMIFAYQYPELVEPLQHQYETEWSALKDSMMRRQSLVSPLPEGSESAKKVNGQ